MKQLFPYTSFNGTKTTKYQISHVLYIFSQKRKSNLPSANTFFFIIFLVYSFSFHLQENYMCKKK